MKPAALVVLNPAARHGRAERRFAAVEGLLRDELETAVVRTDVEGRWRERVVREVRAGVTVVVAAGGDGTVGAVASALLACPEARSVALGAVGLGSSNDYHKPFGRVHHGVPLRIDLAAARPRDVGRARFSRNGEPLVERPFLVSASVGVTARANELFNEAGGRLLRTLKRHWVDGAVVHAAVSALVRHENVPCTLHIAGETRRVLLSNLSVLKTPFLSGMLRYDTKVAPDSGLLAVHLCHDMCRGALVGVLRRLARGRFSGRPGTCSWTTPSVGLELDEPAALELDGELTRARNVAFDVLPRRLLACA